MIHRFFKLLYTFALIVLALSLPFYFLTNVHFDWITVTTYKAKCLSNDQYVVLEGSPLNMAYEFNEVTLNDTIYSNTRQSLNFYCKYYDKAHSYVVAYNQASTNAERVQVNQDFFNFQQSVISNVFSYPESYKLEVVSEETNWNELYNPLVAWLIGAVAAFIALQIVRMSYVYIVFGKLVWHPFRKINIE